MITTVKKPKASKAKKQAFKDMKQSEPYHYLPFFNWMNRYVFAN